METCRTCASSCSRHLRGNAAVSIFCAGYTAMPSIGPSHGKYKSRQVNSPFPLISPGQTSAPFFLDSHGTRFFNQGRRRLPWSRKRQTSVPRLSEWPSGLDVQSCLQHGGLSSRPCRRHSGGYEYHRKARQSGRVRLPIVVLVISLTRSSNSTGAPRIGLPPYEWWSEALHGVAGSPGVNYNATGQFSYATSFAMPIILSAAFDDQLIEDVATIISTEARAFSNAGRAGLDFFTPNINPYDHHIEKCQSQADRLQVQGPSLGSWLRDTR